MKILVTGATGFIGSAIARQVSTQNDFQVIATVRSESSFLPSNIKQILVGNLLATTNYSETVEKVDVLVHAAARVHVMRDDDNEPMTKFRQVNVAGTLNLARQAADAGVKRFVFISSIKVNGEDTNSGTKFSPDDDFIPTDPYGLSKYEAEQGLLDLAKITGMEVVIIRPPLVYGPDVQANFLSMIKWINKGVPLPLGAVHNQRSLVALDNLVSFIIHCVKHPKAANEVFLISDGEDVSTTELLQKVAKAFGKNTLLLPVPVVLMTFVAQLLGKRDMASRLFGSLQVDSSKACDLLGWKPVITMDEQLKKTAIAYLDEKAS